MGRGWSAASFLFGLLLINVWDYFIHNPFCGWAFQCGCTIAWTWAKGWAKCNVHNPDTPNCPWCVCAQYLDGKACLLVARKFFIGVSAFVYVVVAWRRRRASLASCPHSDHASYMVLEGGGLKKPRQQPQQRRWVQSEWLAPLCSGIITWLLLSVAMAVFFFVKLAPDYPWLFGYTRQGTF